MRSELLYILSTKAGNGRAPQLRDHLLQLSEKHDLDTQIQVVETEHEHHVYEAAREFAERATDRPTADCTRVVYALGGDGTSNEVASALRGSRTALGIIPTGTANDFARQLYAEGTTIEDLLARSLSPSLTPIDLIELNDNISLNVTSFGFDTVVLDEALRLLAKRPQLGKRAYTWAVLRTLHKPKTVYASWELLDQYGKTIHGEGELTVATIGNGGYYGGGYRPAPDAELDDGLLDVSLVGKLKALEFPGLLLRYRKGKHTDHPQVQMAKVTEGVFRAAPGEVLLGNYDGIILREAELRFRVLPASILLARI